MSLMPWAAPAAAVILMAARRLLLWGAGPAPEPAPPRAARACLLAVVAGAFALRLWLAATYPAHWSEPAETERSLRIWDLLDGSQRGNSPEFHAPLPSIVTYVWVRLGELVGAGSSLVVLRLPSILFGTCSVWLLARFGRALGAPVVGLSAAALLAFTPQPALLSVPQEHYALESVTLLWFAERCATYLARRRPVYLSLALATASALWSGYPNALVVVPAAVLLFATAWRRRQRAAALYTAALVVLLLAPLLAPGLNGLRLYLQAIGFLQQASDGGLHGHPPIDPTTHFARGSFRGGVALLSRALLGPADALLGPAALVMLWRERLRALPILLALAVFVAVGGRLAMNVQNFGPVFPAVLLVFAWGGAVLPAGVRPRTRALFHGLLVAAGVLSAHRAWPLHTRRSADGFFDYWDRRRFDAVLAREPAALPVLLLMVGSDSFGYELCQGAGGVRRRVGCLCRMVDGRGALQHMTMQGRAVALLRGDQIGSARFDLALAESIRELPATPPWSTLGWITVRELPNPGDHEQLPREVIRFLAAHCPNRFRTGRFDVMRCDVQTSERPGVW